MPSLTVPLSIWVSYSSEEKDAAYLQAGFSPLYPVVDAGTDTTTVRFSQDVAFTGDFNTGVPGVAPADPSGSMQPGDDLRDYQTISVDPRLTGDNPVTDEFGNPVAAAGITMAGRALRLILGGGGGRLTAAMWNSLPSIVRTALTQVGIGVGALIAFNGDIPFITLPGQGDPMKPFIGPTQAPVDIQIGAPMQQLGVSVIGSWNTNPKNPAEGVTFYRLSNGWLAVQNKRGRWKTWKPKRPIVLYPGGASNLKTMLRADKALNRQAKQLAAMLNRRAPRPRKTPKGPIIIESGPGNVITR